MNDILFPFDTQTGYALSSVDSNPYNENKILRTTDGGDHWQIIDPGNTQELLCIFFVTPQIGYIGGRIDRSGAVLLLTTDSGLTWERVPVPFGYNISAVSFPNRVNTGYIAGHTAGSILKTINGGGVFATVPDLSAGNQLTDKILVQNYPNPFNESTTITWRLLREAHVISKVFDFTGREVKALVYGNQSKGEHKVKLNAKGLPAGVYFYQLQADGRIVTWKMIVYR